LTETQQLTKFEVLPPGVPVLALDPRNYAFVPSTWTQRIRPAGCKTLVSEYVGTILHYSVDA